MIHKSGLDAVSLFIHNIGANNRNPRRDPFELLRGFRLLGM
jgi:hypothetical protein